MKKISYSKYEPDTWVKPVWLNSCLTLLLALSIILVSYLLIAYLTPDHYRSFVFWVLLAVSLPFLYILVYGMITDSILQTRVLPNGILLLPRSKIDISAIKKIVVRKKSTLLSSLLFCEIHTDDHYCYEVSISDMEQFTEELKTYNSKIEICSLV